MRKNGKSLERVVRLIQESLKDHPRTEVFQNYKIDDRVGGKREIDVILKTQVNGFDFLIAIECKDYSHPVDIEKIDAFNSKCNSIPGICKKIFVSKSGYGSGAIRNAKLHDIQLYKVSDLDPNSILSWFPILTELRPLINIRSIKFHFENFSEKFVEQEYVIQPQVYLDNKVICDNVIQLVYSDVMKHKQMLLNLALLRFMENKELMLSDGHSQLCSLNFDDKFYLLSENNSKLPIQSIDVEIKLGMKEGPIEVTHASSFGLQGREDITKQVTISMGQNDHSEVLEIVRINDNNYKMFIREESGELTPLSTLGTYDPVTGKFTSSIEMN